MVQIDNNNIYDLADIGQWHCELFNIEMPVSMEGLAEVGQRVCNTKKKSIEVLWDFYKEASNLGHISEELKLMLASDMRPTIKLVEDGFEVYNFKGKFCQKFGTMEEVKSYMEWSVKTGHESTKPFLKQTLEQLLSA